MFRIIRCATGLPVVGAEREGGPGIVFVLGRVALDDRPGIASVVAVPGEVVAETRFRQVELT